MSRNIDEQVVKMSFDNSKFNTDVNDTTNALNNLDNKLGIIGKNDALDKMSKDMSGLATTFSKSGIIMFGVLSKLGDELATLGKRIAYSITNGIRDGLAEYNLQIDATQTILSNVKDEGKGIKDVTAALDELNRYADKTIYNFSEMTRNIGMFTAAGTKLDQSVSTIKGLANAAAIVGANSATASRAWYQVSQAMAAGTFRLMDWRSLETSNIAGEQFQEVIKIVARATKATDKHGRNIDQMIKKYGSLRDTLKEGWLTAGRFSEAMSILSGDIDDKTLRKKGYTEKQIQKLREIANEAEEAATAVKTFKQLLSTVAETIGSGWAETFRIAIGDIEEAKDLFTGINNILTDFIEKGQIIRKFIVTKIFGDDGGKYKLKQVIDNTLSSFSAFYRAFRAGLMNIFSIDRIRSGASKLIDFMMKTSEALTINQKKIEKNYVVHNAKEAKAAEEERKKLSKLEKTSKWNHEIVTKAIENVVRIGRGAASAIDIVWSSIKQVALFITNKIPFFKDFYNNLKEGNEGLLSSAGKVADVITTIRNMIVDGQLITKLLEAIDNKIKEIISGNPALQMLVSFLKWIKNSIKNVLNIIKNVDFSGVIKVFNDIGNIVKKIFNIVISQDLFQSIFDIIKMFLGFGKDILKGFSNFLSGFVENINKTDARTKDLLSTIVKVTAAFMTLRSLITKIPDLAFFLYKLNVPQLFKYLTRYMRAKAFVETSEAIRNIGISVGILAASMFALSIIPFDALIQRFSLLAIGILIFTKAIRSMGGGISVIEIALDSISDLAKASVFATLAVAMLTVVAAMGLIKKMFPDPKELKTYIGSMIKLLIALSASVFLITKAVGNFSSVLASIMKVAMVESIMATIVGSVLAMTVILGVISLIPEAQLAKALLTLFVISLVIAALVGTFSLLSGIKANPFKLIAVIGGISSVLVTLASCLSVLALVTSIPNADLYKAANALVGMLVVTIGLAELIGYIKIATNFKDIAKSATLLKATVGVLWSLSLMLAVLSIIPTNNLGTAIEALTNATINLISLLAAVTIASKYIQNVYPTMALLSVVILNMSKLMRTIAIVATIFKANNVEIEHVGLAMLVLAAAITAIALVIAELAVLSKVINKNELLIKDVGKILLLLHGVMSYITIVSAELVIMAHALKGVSWVDIGKSAAVFAAAIGSMLIIIAALSKISQYINAFDSLGSFALIVGLSSSLMLTISLMSAAMAGIAFILKDISWETLGKSAAVFVSASGIFIGVISALVAISKVMIKDKLAIFAYIAVSASINTFILSLGISLALAASSIKKLSNVNINGNTIAVLGMYVVVITILLAIASIMSKLPSKLTFNFISLSVALLLISVFAESIARVINGLLRYSEEMPEMGEKIGTAIANFCKGVAGSVKNAVPELVKSLVDILYVFVKSIWDNVPKIAAVVGMAIAAMVDLAIKVATTKIKLSNGMTLHTGLILEIFGINHIVKVLTGRSVAERLGKAFAGVLRTALVNKLSATGLTMNSTWGSILSVTLAKLGFFGKGVKIVSGQVQMSLKAMGAAAWSIGAIAVAAVGAFTVASAAVHAWRQYTHEEMSYNNADIDSWGKAIQAIFTDSEFRTQAIINGVSVFANVVAAIVMAVVNAILTIIKLIGAAAAATIGSIKSISKHLEILDLKRKKIKDPKNAEEYDKKIKELSKGIIEDTKDAGNIIKSIGNDWKIWWENLKTVGEGGGNWGEWSKGGEQAANNFTNAMDSTFAMNFADFKTNALNAMNGFLGEQSQQTEEFNYEEYKKKYGLSQALLKIAENNKDALIGLNKEQATELLRQKIFEATNDAELASKASAAIINNLVKQKIGEQVITEEAAKSLVQTESEQSAAIMNIRDNQNKVLSQQLKDEYKMKQLAATRSARLRELEAKGIMNLTATEKKEWENLKQGKAFNPDSLWKSQKYNAKNISDSFFKQNKSSDNFMDSLWKNQNYNLKNMSNNFFGGKSSSGGTTTKSGKTNIFSNLTDRISDLYNKYKAGNPDTSLFNAEELEKLLAKMLGDDKKDPGKKKKKKKGTDDKDVKNKAKNLKTDLEKERADLTPIIDLDKLSSDANKASQIVTTSLLAAQNAAIGDYINKDSELNPFMKDRWQNVYNFTQNNYSPKALSRIDIYRQTERQLGMSRGF